MFLRAPAVQHLAPDGAYSMGSTCGGRSLRAPFGEQVPCFGMGAFQKEKSRGEPCFCFIILVLSLRSTCDAFGLVLSKKKKAGENPAFISLCWYFLGKFPHWAARNRLRLPNATAPPQVVRGCRKYGRPRHPVPVQCKRDRLTSRQAPHSIPQHPDVPLSARQDLPAPQ